MLVHTATDTKVAVRSAGYGHTIGMTTFSAVVPAELAGPEGFEVEVMNQRHPATLITKPLYDPTNESVRA